MLETPTAALDGTAQVLFTDDFSAGLRAGGPDAPWDLRPAGPLPAGDGVVTTGPDGLVVVPTGVDERTGAPAFVPVPPGPADILRWATFLRHTAPSGFPGFAVPEHGALTMSATAAATVTGGSGHPFTDVTDPETDLRLGAGASIIIDRATRMVFDFVFTNAWVLAIYERLPGAGQDDAFFSYAVPLVRRQPESYHDVAFTYDRAAGSARWSVDGEQHLSVDRIGLLELDEQHLLRSGGVQELLAPEQLNCGFAMFSKGTWGQGVRLGVRSMAVSTTTPADPTTTGSGE